MSNLENGQLKEEMSLVEIATAILAEQKKAMAFTDLVTAIQNFLEIDTDAFQSRLSQFYTDLNTDGSFISLGNNEWALRSWYPVDAIDESIHEIDDEEEKPKKKKASKKVNVFADSASADDDVIDYNDDDPEDDDFDDLEGHNAETGDGNDAEDDDDAEKDEAIEDNLTELAGSDDLDDLSDGDEEQ
ncbi:DNA-directed RNA polymerase subunit delta [Fructobacillus evanidus]|uniref:Probable DNA-directed RNA polymerase subunit delta n=1 Tax=Fructobacillus evanidus TaxID=3064281 RepID=A0ABM9MQC0_9LACO|nr:DNA-directed RNA polymerase [Fructobacillus sp. LMG 32999]CAK1232469.1 DNA-directed RNA polymerase [Fructobacillus sp. LMG 32999]CAK1236134.1 DNA-directed RNA polymerase [Fructobacillus sp. LMG 32999]CAK1238367.1 DNA-directed RNA polymerase [Fructobacillus sp. LMG 32999]CAK1240233.1 DNA-directed RNA polymerase [Fructobacillus sp. LMG 32999]